MATETKSLQMYALVDASAKPEVLERVERVVSVYGRRIRRGCVLTPHGESPVIFFEVKKKECPIVETLAALAEQYSLYPMYVIQEHKDHLPKNSRNIWYMVDEVKFELPVMTEDEFNEWKQGYAALLREIYRDNSVFIKSFMYYGKSGTPHVMSFNTERSPRYRGKDIGVPEWNDAMELIVKQVGGQEVFKAAVRYTNL